MTANPTTNLKKLGRTVGYDNIRRGQRDILKPGLLGRQGDVLREFEGVVEEALSELEKRRAAAKIWAKDAGLWSTDAHHRAIVGQSLGWLTVAEMMREQSEELGGFADEVKRAGFSGALLLGMGGSSLCADVLRLTFGAASGFPLLHVLDTTDPATIARVEGGLDLSRTLVIVASKSGTTPEIVALHRYFFEKVERVKGASAGGQFVAITDPGTPLEALARAQGFRRIFLNPTDIGGRYSALSYFGLVPAALIGLDVPKLLDRAEQMAHSCVACVPTRENPGLWLGAVMGALARSGRDKVTFVCSPEVSSFGTWVEQLIAESTGKDGIGIVPVEGEAVGTPGRYGGDRLFIYLRLDGTRDVRLDRKVKTLERAGHPVIPLRLEDLYDLGSEFFRWEFATAVAGAVIGVNPFDQPNVQESKDNTKRLLNDYKATGTLPEGEPIFSGGDIRLYGDEGTASALKGRRRLSMALRAHLSRIREGDYVALTAYLERSAATEQALEGIRAWIRDRFKVATTLGYGPRFLHSTGQLHKGGGDNGVFLQLTAEDRLDLPIPEEPYTFGIVKRAQALGDLGSLQARGRRVLRVHFTRDVNDGLTRIRQALGKIAGKE